DDAAPAAFRSGDSAAGNDQLAGRRPRPGGIDVVDDRSEFDGHAPRRLGTEQLRTAAEAHPVVGRARRPAGVGRVRPLLAASATVLSAVLAAFAAPFAALLARLVTSSLDPHAASPTAAAHSKCIDLRMATPLHCVAEKAARAAAIRALSRRRGF